MCDGEPIQCAILEQQWLHRCEAEIPSETEILQEAGLTEYTDVKGQLYTEVDAGEVIGEFDQSGFYGSRSCPASPTITLWGASLELPMEEACRVAEIIGLIVMAGALLQAFWIVSGAF
ncbi:MAG: hypothetical protein CSB44_03705 [Gammaproteobacteria bacterium]|nr:MAG: hypothetical protein CSB44_03705 [Gammaproteobacteria bacterium]